MNQKKLGYIQMVWTCPNCQTKNAGSLRLCKNCGASMPENAQFEKPIQEEVITDSKKIEQAKSGADIYCAYCGFRNSADTANCQQCGAALAEGTERESGKVYDSQPHSADPIAIHCTTCGAENSSPSLQCASCGAPLNTTVIPSEPTTSAPAGKKTGKGCLSIGIVLLIILFALFYFLFFRTTEKTASVASKEWTTEQEILHIVEKSDAEWKDQIPSQGRIQQCEKKPRSESSSYSPGAKEVCGTPYLVDKGNGFSEKVQDCKYQVYDDYCRYTYKDWAIKEVLQISGIDNQPYFVSPALNSEEKLGNGQNLYKVLLKDDQEKTYQYSPFSLEEYTRFSIGDVYQMEVNGLDAVVNLEKK